MEKKFRCPLCYSELAKLKIKGDNKTQLDPGDIIICADCLSTLVINEDHSAREGTLQDFKRIEDETLFDMYKAMDNVLQERKSKIRAEILKTKKP